MQTKGAVWLCTDVKTGKFTRESTIKYMQLFFVGFKDHYVLE